MDGGWGGCVRGVQRSVDFDVRCGVRGAYDGVRRGLCFV